MHLPQGAAANLQQAFDRSLTVYTGQILVDQSLAEAVYSAHDAYPTTSHPHPPAPEDSNMHGPNSDALLSQAATVSGSVQSSLIMSITLKVHTTAARTGSLQAMGPASEGSSHGAFHNISMGMGVKNAHQTGGVDSRVMTPGRGPESEAIPATGDASEGSAESVPGTFGAMGPSLPSQGSHDGSLPAGPPMSGHSVMADQPGSLNPGMDGSAIHAMAPSLRAGKMPEDAAGMP